MAEGEAYLPLLWRYLVLWRLWNRMDEKDRALAMILDKENSSDIDENSACDCASTHTLLINR